MSSKRLLLLSNSVNYGQGYLEHAAASIKDFLGASFGSLLFIPFAAVTRSYDEYAATVRAAFAKMGYGVTSLHETEDARRAVESAEAIIVGGGNTFHLLRELYQADLIEPIRARVIEGIPYIGWSAGSNVACPTIKTTNDMPIVEPPSFNAFNLVPFQINPHYTDAQLANHSGETREQRLVEFTTANRGVYVVGLREGSTLKVEGARVQLLGGKEARIFRSGMETREYEASVSLNFLLE